MRGMWFLDAQFVVQSAPHVVSLLSGNGFTAGSRDGESQRDPQAGFTDVFDAQGNLTKLSLAFDDIPKGSSVRVKMQGPIIKYGDACTYGADEIVAALYAASRNQNVASIILEVDSPGGSVNAIGPFLEFAANNTKPVIALVDQCCSLGYWAAAAVADKIYVDNPVSAVIGSIGVQISFMDAIPYYEDQGYKHHHITPPESKDKNSVFKEVLEGNYDRIKKEMLSPLAILFQDAVKAARPNLIQEDGVLNGKTYMYEDAMRLGLIDGITTATELAKSAATRNVAREIRSALSDNRSAQLKEVRRLVSAIQS